METKKVLGIIFSLIFVGAFTFVLSWGIINFNKVKDGMSGTGVYTKEDINKSYEDGYNTALTDKEEYTKLIASYRDTITTLNDNISQLNSQVTILQNNNKDYSNQIDKLNTQKITLETQVNNLTTIKTNNETTITSLNSQITSLQNQVTNLTNSGEDKSEQITTLNSQITTLQNTVSQLQTTNDMNVATIAGLNTEITNLNNQICDMTLQSQNSQSQINALNNKISELQASVTYYESYIAQLENGEQVVATFEYDGSVYNIQIVNKGSILSVTTPTDTDRLKFNYWTVNGEQVDLSTYTISTNTKFVANTTKYYCIQALNMSGDLIKTSYEAENSDIFVGKSLTGSWGPYRKDGYEFDGWSNGENLYNFNDYIHLTRDMILTPTFTKLHTVTFMYEEETKSTQTIRNGNYATNIAVDNTDYKVFNGWLLNGTSVDITTYKIVADTTFVADITYKYDVKFMVDDKVYNTQLVQKNRYVNMPENPTTTDYFVFNGWLLNGGSIDVSTYQITADTIFVADVTHKYDVSYYVDGELYKSIIVEEGGYATNYGVGKTGYDHLGWTVDGTNLVTISAYPITENTTFNAVFEIVAYTLTVNYMNGDESTIYSATMGETYTLSTPTLDGYNFVEWRIASGDGSISGNVFTFGGSDATVYACYNFCQTTITYWTTGTVNYEGTTHTMEGSGGGSSSGGSGGVILCSTDVEPMAYAIYEDTLSLACDVDDSLIVTIDSGTMLLTITTDGEYTKTKNSSTSYTITWTNASYISIVVKGSSVVLL